MKNIFSKYGFPILLSFSSIGLVALLFFPFPSIQEEIKIKKKSGDLLIAQSLVEIENPQLTGKGGSWGKEALDGYKNLIKLETELTVRNKSNMEISLIRGKFKPIFRNFKDSVSGLIDFELGSRISPNSEGRFFTNLWFSSKSEDFFAIKQELENKERRLEVVEIKEVWAEEPAFNPFASIISYFTNKNKE